MQKTEKNPEDPLRKDHPLWDQETNPNSKEKSAKIKTAARSGEHAAAKSVGNSLPFEADWTLSPTDANRPIHPTWNKSCEVAMLATKFFGQNPSCQPGEFSSR